MTLAILILGLVIATSFIAYWADNLGKKLGKKRISLLGIRPKQTATLISILSSVAIMLLTVGVLLAVFSNLRNALLRYDSAKLTAQKLRKENNQLLNNINGLRSQRDALNTQLTTLQKASLKASAQRQAAVEQLSKVRASLDDLRKQLKATAHAEKLAKAGEKDAKAKAQAAAQRYSKVAQSLKEAQEKVNTSRTLLAKSLDQLRSTHQSLAKTNHDFDEARTQLTQANEQLGQTQKRLASVQQNFELVDRQVKSTLDQYRDAVRNVESLRKRRDDLETQLNLRQQELAGLEFVASQVSTGNVEVAYGTVFSQTLVPSKTPENIARAQLQALLEAGQRAVQGKFTLSLITPRPLYNDQPLSDTDSDKLLDYWAQRLSQFDVPVSVRLVAARAHAKGEQNITTRFILVPIRTIFTKGEVVESSIINSNDGDALIFNQLLHLMNLGETKAREKGSMPITTAENPFFYATGTNERTFQALRTIQSFNGPVKVKMVASQNITTIDLMQVQFEVSSPAPTMPSLPSS